MPKIVDHDQRRAEIAEAFQQHVAERGFAATTYARVAAVAGVSVGTIQYYFDDRKALLRYAFDDLLRHRDARINARIAAGEQARRSIRQIIDQAILELLPLDDDRRREHRMTRQLAVEAVHDADLARLAVDAHQALHLRMRTAVRNGTECGEVSADVDTGIAADRILGAAYGLADIVTLTSDPAGHHRDHLYAVLDPALASVFTGSCRRHVQR